MFCTVMFVNNALTSNAFALDYEMKRWSRIIRRRIIHWQKRKKTQSKSLATLMMMMMMLYVVYGMCIVVTIDIIMLTIYHANSHPKNYSWMHGILYSIHL